MILEISVFHRTATMSKWLPTTALQLSIATNRTKYFLVSYHDMIQYTLTVFMFCLVLPCCPVRMLMYRIKHRKSQSTVASGILSMCSDDTKPSLARPGTCFILTETAPSVHGTCQYTVHYSI